MEQVVRAGGIVEPGSVPWAKWWEVVSNSDIVKSGIKKLSNSEWFKQKNSKKVTLHLEVRDLTPGLHFDEILTFSWPACEVF